MCEHFSDRLRRVLMLANNLACENRSEYIYPEHILLGLISEAQNPNGGGVAAAVFKARGISLVEVKKRVIEFEKVLHDGQPTPGKRPQSPQVKQIIKNACEEATRHNDSSVGTWHLLLALLKEKEGPVAGLLADFGLEYEQLCQWKETSREQARASWPEENFFTTDKDFAKYEYKIIDRDGISPENLEEIFLKEQTKEGWELVSVLVTINHSPYRRRFYFKRPVSPRSSGETGLSKE